MNNKNKSKRYYWIKIKDTFLTSETVDYLISQDGGNGFAYVVLYQCLCLKTINTNGQLARQINDVLIPYDFAKLKRDLKWFTLEQIQRAFQLFSQLGLIYTQEDNVIAIANFKEMVGSETMGAIEKREQKKKKEGIEKGIENVYQENRDKRLEIRDKILDTRYIDTNKIKLDKTRYKQSSLLEILVKNDFLTENELQDTSFDDLLNCFVETYGYVDTKIKVEYLMSCYKTNSQEIENKYLYLRATLQNAFKAI